VSLTFILATQSKPSGVLAVKYTQYWSPLIGRKLWGVRMLLTQLMFHRSALVYQSFK
jgi:hypothetical protein